MRWMMLLRRPLGALLSLAFAAGIAAIMYFAFGKGILNNVKNLTRDGGGPQEERMVDRRNFGPIVKTLRKEVGSAAQLLTVTMRPTSVEFAVRDGSRAKGYRAEPGSDDLDDIGVNVSGSGTLEESSWSIGKLKAAAPGRIAKAISRKESGDFHLSIATLERVASGKLLWDMKGTINGRGVSYTARPDGSKVRTSTRQKACPGACGTSASASARPAATRTGSRPARRD